MDKALTIYIADDHPIVVEGLQEILKSRKNWTVAGVAHDGVALIDLSKQKPADVVILDINMPLMNGIQCTRWLKENCKQTKVLVLTMYPERTFADELIKAGADGCLLKSRGSRDLLEAIERVTRGKSYYDWISDFKTKAPQDIPHRLSERELEVIKLIVKSKSSNEIAGVLFISEETVKTHRKNIFKKLNIHHVTELMTFAMNNNLL